MNRDGMKMKKKRNIKGFSLPELLIGMAIFLIVLALVNAFMSTGLSTYKYTMSQEHSIAKGRTAFNKLVDVVRYNPYKVLLPAAEGDFGPEFRYEDKDGNTITININDTTKSLNLPGGESFAVGVATSLKVTKESANQFTIKLTLNDRAYTGSPDVVFETTVQCFNM